MLGSTPSKDFLVAPEVEAKVRNLLARTELKEIAPTARVLVEIADEPSTAQEVSAQHPSSLATSKITLVPRMRHQKM